MQSAAQKIHFIGIGGTAMAGAALMAQELGFAVTGSDQNLYSPTVDELRKNAVAFVEGYAAQNLDHAPDLIVLGNAISRGNAELEAALNRRIRILSLPGFIADFVIRDRQSYVIAGTHGKTTTASLVTHILLSSGIDTGFMIGGVVNNFAHSAAIGSAPCFVIEGDEYDTSIFDQRSKFLSYRPTHALINNIEFDHADIFADLADVEKAFARLVKIIPQNGILVLNADNASCMKLAQNAQTRIVTFGEAANADYRLIEVTHGEITRITAQRKRETFTLTTRLKGKHNALNILAAFALLEDKSLSVGLLQAALDSFGGVRRRLEVKLDNAAFTVIEDFAHHPTAIRANLTTLKELYGDRRIVVLIEPRSNTMVRKFFQQILVQALDPADVICIDAIYRAEKYSPDDRLDLQQLKTDLEAAGKKVFLLPAANKAEVVAALARKGDVLCFMTNGNFGGLIAETVKSLSEAAD